MQEHVEPQRIPVKVYRTADLITIAAPMAGIMPEDIAVEITQDGRLILAGELRGALKGVKDLVMDEWSVGAYQRTLDLPAPVDGQTANVTYGNGVLVVALPIAGTTRAAHLTIETVAPDRGAYFGHAGHTSAQQSGAESEANTQ